MNILLTSVGRRSYLVQYFREALRDQGSIHVANSSKISPAFQYADYAVVSPLIYDESYIPFLLSYCERNKINAIISLFDVDLPILSQNKKKFEKIGTNVLVSDSQVIEICNDKWKTYQFLIQNDIATPKTFLTVNEVLDAIETKKIAFPLIVKPRWGMGSIGIFEAENEEELFLFYKKTRRNIQNTYLKYEAGKNLEQAVIIQEKLQGDEYGLDVINDFQKNYITTIVKLKYAMRAGETDCAVTVQDDKAKQLGKRVSLCLGHIVNLDVDVFISDNQYYVLEMNARFGGGYPFSHMAGVDLPLMIIRWLQGGKTDQSLLTERINIMSQKNIKLVRLYSDVEKKIIETNRKNEILEAITELESTLVPSFSERGLNISEYAEKLALNGKVYLVKDEKNESIGILAAYMNDKILKTAYLSFLAISNEYRGMHLGKKLLLYVEKEAFNQGMTEFKLEVWKNNYAAIKFYEHVGYKKIETSTQNTFFMVKKL